QFAHVDPERARATPFGGTIAHAARTRSLLAHQCPGFVPVLADRKLLVDHGSHKDRLVAPGRLGRRIRARGTPAAAAERRPGQVVMRIDVTIEIENEDKPAVVAEWLSLHVVG